MKAEGMTVTSVFLIFLATSGMPLKAGLMLVETVSVLTTMVVLRCFNDPMCMARYSSRLAWSQAILCSLAKQTGWGALFMSFCCLRFAYAAAMNVNFLGMFVVCYLYLFWVALAGHIHSSLLLIGAMTLIPSLGMDLDMPVLRYIYDPYEWMNTRIMWLGALFHGIVACLAMILFYRRRRT